MPLYASQIWSHYGLGNWGGDGYSLSGASNQKKFLQEHCNSMNKNSKEYRFSVVKTKEPILFWKYKIKIGNKKK